MASSSNGAAAPAGSSSNPFAPIADENKGKGKAAAADDHPMGEDAEDDDDDDEEEATEAEEVRSTLDIKRHKILEPKLTRT